MRRDLLFVVRQLRLRVISPDDVLHRSQRRERFGADAFQIEVKLSVGIEGFQFIGEPERQRRLTHATHTLRSADRHARLQVASQFCQLVFAAREIWRQRRELMKRIWRECGRLINVLVAGQMIAAGLNNNGVAVPADNRGAGGVPADEYIPPGRFRVFLVYGL